MGSLWARLAVAGVACAAIFIAGMFYANWKNAEDDVEIQKLITAAVAAREKELKDEHALRVEEETGARIELQDDLDIIRKHRDSLIEGIRVAQLTKPVAEVRVEACLESDDEDIQVVVANPFDDAFRVLWNNAGTRPVRTGSDP